MKAMVEHFPTTGSTCMRAASRSCSTRCAAAAAGCISATANVNPAPIAKLAATWQNADADAQQAALDALRTALLKYPMIAALKALVAHFARDEAWARLRPPLVALSAGERAALLASLPADFSIAGL